ncbi:hypothetical protein ACJX0J_009219, partial [Zea mays]
MYQSQTIQDSHQHEGTWINLNEKDIPQRPESILIFIMLILIAVNCEKTIGNPIFQKKIYFLKKTVHFRFPL